MTPAQFAATYRPTANQVSSGTGIDPIALLAQWANETNWGTAWAGYPNNLGNIMFQGQAISYPSLSAFAAACIQTFTNGLYQNVLMARNAVDQLAAIVASPWSAGHYGGSLLGFYQQLEVYELTPDEHNMLQQLHDALVPTAPSVASYVTNVIDLLHAMQPKLDKLVAAIGTSGAGLTPAQLQLLQEAHDAISRIEASLKAA